MRIGLEELRRIQHDQLMQNAWKGRKERKAKQSKGKERKRKGKEGKGKERKICRKTEEKKKRWEDEGKKEGMRDRTGKRKRRMGFTVIKSTDANKMPGKGMTERK